MSIIKITPKGRLSTFVKEIYKTDFINEERIPVLDDCCHDLVLFKEANATFYAKEFESGISICYSIFSLFNVSPPFSIVPANSLSFLTIKFQPWCNNLIFHNYKSTGVFDLSEEFAALLNKEEVNSFFELKDPFCELENRLSRFFGDVQLQEKQILIKRLVEKIIEEKGQIRVSELEIHIGFSRQYLNKLFREQVHYSIKHFIGMVRVMNAVKIQVNQPEISMTELAYEVGYFDQAHFVRDFHKVAGMSPKKFFNLNGAFFRRHKA
ncbi:helix-turn-helix domain-containing protein [Marivirga salinae]|uniref:Helix-turn-helix domain-containing protein n=1 Tax=Marivirga salinarum TaxID=3059078 RepID=A0AA51NA28_9BACT|nr:helix-turn-helix domain-containing protein [Marivirga sp. BDSF4-3]WMN11457.1 helix-turn-helix domain-containing protein [Marivirga sp. BDSF4-3]